MSVSSCHLVTPSPPHVRVFLLIRHDGFRYSGTAWNPKSLGEREESEPCGNGCKCCGPARRPGGGWRRRQFSRRSASGPSAGAGTAPSPGPTPNSPPTTPPRTSPASPPPPGSDTGEYGRRVVAYVYDNIPVTREELGEYLIARFGPDRLEFLVNRKLVEMACQAKGVTVTDAEVDAQIREDLKAFGPHMTLQDFSQQVLKRFNKSMYEWREDVIRPKLAMQKLVRPSVTVTPEDVQKAFEARYGPKVQCRMIVLPKDDPHKSQVWEKVSKSEDEFRDHARKQFIPELASKGGEVPPVYKHFPDPKIEREAFSLKEGQVSSLIQVQDGTWVILRCDKHIAGDASKRVEDERMALSRDIFEHKLAQKIPVAFQELRQLARPRLLLTNGQQPTVANVAPPPAPANALPPVPASVTGDPRPTPPSGN